MDQMGLLMSLSSRLVHSYVGQLTSCHTLQVECVLLRHLRDGPEIFTDAVIDMKGHTLKMGNIYRKSYIAFLHTKLTHIFEGRLAGNSGIINPA